MKECQGDLLQIYVFRSAESQRITLFFLGVLIENQNLTWFGEYGKICLWIRNKYHVYTEIKDWILHRELFTFRLDPYD